MNQNDTPHGNPLQRTAQWFNARHGCLTASRFADVLARKRDGKPTKAYFDLMDTLVAERLTGQSIGVGDGPALQWGRDHEDEARREYEVRSRNLVDLVGFVPHPEVPWLGASPDGLVGEDGLLEIKCPYSTLVQIARVQAGVVPPEYQPQMLLQLICTGRKWVDFVSYDPRLLASKAPGLGYWQIRFEPAEDVKAAALAAAMDFLAAVDERLKAIQQKMEKK